MRHLISGCCFEPLSSKCFHGYHYVTFTNTTSRVSGKEFLRIVGLENLDEDDFDVKGGICKVLNDVQTLE